MPLIIRLSPFSTHIHIHENSLMFLNNFKGRPNRFHFVLARRGSKKRSHLSQTEKWVREGGVLSLDVPCTWTPFNPKGKHSWPRNTSNGFATLFPVYLPRVWLCIPTHCTYTVHPFSLPACDLAFQVFLSSFQSWLYAWLCDLEHCTYFLWNSSMRWG